MSSLNLLKLEINGYHHTTYPNGDLEPHDEIIGTAHVNGVVHNLRGDCPQWFPFSVQRARRDFEKSLTHDWTFDVLEERELLRSTGASLREVLGIQARPF